MYIDVYLVIVVILTLSMEQWRTSFNPDDVAGSDDVAATFLKSSSSQVFKTVLISRIALLTKKWLVIAPPLDYVSIKLNMSL